MAVRCGDANVIYMCLLMIKHAQLAIASAAEFLARDMMGWFVTPISLPCVPFHEEAERNGADG